MKMTCIITDDEPMARKGLQSYVEKVDFLTLTGVCEDALQLNALLRRETPDLLFLDIEMPCLSGLDLLASLSAPPKVIITTAYERYALRGYELDVVDYLLKPISFERFLKAVNKVYERLKRERTAASPAAEEYIFVRSDKQMHKLFVGDILFVESMENYLYIYTENGRLLVRSTLKHMQEMLPSDMFLKVHKSYLVQLAKVQRIEGNRLFIGSHAITIARNFRREVLSLIGSKVIG